MRLPGDDEHHAIFGMNGSGKTVFAAWTLAQRSFHRRPWIVVDGKRDPFLARIPLIEEIDIRRKPPKRRGLYIVHPDPADFDAGTVTAWLYDVWRQERTGLLIDEGYLFNARDPALRAVLTQGRTKRIPLICLSQRPSWISPFILSESSHKTCFFLQHSSDIDRVQEWMPEADVYNLPQHHFYWYSLRDREFLYCSPCPGEEDILDMFDARRVRKTWL